MGTLKLSNRTASLLLCLLLPGGVFASELGKRELDQENTKQPEAVDISQKSYPAEVKDGETAVGVPGVLPAVEEREPVPVREVHAVSAGPGKLAVAPVVSSQAGAEAEQPSSTHLTGSAGARLSATGLGEPSAHPSATAQGSSQQQQTKQPSQAEVAPNSLEGNQAPRKHAFGAVVSQEPGNTKPSLHPEVSHQSPTSEQVIGSALAPGAGKASGNKPGDANLLNYGDANGDKVNNEANVPASQSPVPTRAPTTKATKPTPTTTVVPGRPSQDKELLRTKPTNMLPDVPKDSAGIPPPSSVGLADYSHAREPDSEEELEPLAPKEPSPMQGGVASVGAQPVAGPAGDSRPEKPLDASGAAGSVSFPPAQDDSHFFAYFLTAVVLCVVGYLAFHNKRKILALILEGRHERQRRHNGHYRRLDSVDDTSSSRKGRGSF